MSTDARAIEGSCRAVKSVDQQLAELYTRRLAVQNLIRCLESYAECQVKNGSRERLKRA